MKWATGDLYTNNFSLLINFRVGGAVLFLSNILYLLLSTVVCLCSHGSLRDVIFTVPCAALKSNKINMKIIMITFFL